MASKTLTNTSYVTGTSSSHYEYRIELSSVLNSAGNYSTVTCKSYIRRKDYMDFDYRSFNTGGTADVTHTCTGESNASTSSASYDTRYDTNFDLLFQNSWIVDHNADGTKTLTITSDFDADASSGMTGAYVSTTFTLDTNPRGSVINSVSNFNLEDTFSVSVTKYSSSFTDTLAIKYGGTTIKTITGYTSGASINLSDTEILTAYNALGSNMSGTFTFNLTTKSGSTTIGTDSDTATGTAKGTMYINSGGTWKRTVPHRNVSGAWKKCIAYINSGGTWKRCKG